VLTARGDLTRLGLDNAEPELSQAALASGRFGKRVGYPVDGKIYAQPLYVPDLRIDGGVHNVVIVATEHDSVYAFDADATSAVAPLWHVSLLQPGARTFQAASDRVAKNRLCNSIVPEVGITSTPVIDWATQTIYVMALDVEHGVMTYRLHALALATGTDTRPSTVVSASVSGSGLDSVNGAVAFQATEEQQRMALTEVNGVVYAGFASWCGWAPYHGWVLGFSASTLAREIVFNTSPNSWGAGLWESESGITVDAHGHLYLVTGNGPFDLNRGGPDAGDSVLEVVPEHGTLHILDYFTPFDQLCRAEHDQDLGSGAPLVVPGEHELVLSSKTGAVYVLSRGLAGQVPLDLGALQPEDRAAYRRRHDQAGAELQHRPGRHVGHLGVLVAGSRDLVRLRQRLDLAADAVPPRARRHDRPHAGRRGPARLRVPRRDPRGDRGRRQPGSGVVWTVDQTHGATLRAFAADDVSKQLWNSAADQAGTASIRASSTTSPCRPPRTAW
jgi:hypothetical protein